MWRTLALIALVLAWNLAPLLYVLPAPSRHKLDLVRRWERDVVSVLRFKGPQ